MINLKILVISFLILIFGTSCNKTESEDPEVTYKFQLLNEDKEPATVFAEGENFFFHLVIESDDPEWKFNRFLNKDPNFLRVYRIEEEEQIDIGVSFKSYWCETILYDCGHDVPYVFELPWVTEIGENEVPNQNVYPPFCMFNETDYLPKGKYVTYFDDRLEFVRCSEELEEGFYEKLFYTTELKHFEINFEIN